jgi:hypothetical protein
MFRDGLMISLQKLNTERLSDGASKLRNRL